MDSKLRYNIGWFLTWDDFLCFSKSEDVKYQATSNHTSIKLRVSTRDSLVGFGGYIGVGDECC